MSADGKGRYVYVATLPRCDFEPLTETPARFDFRTLRGPWANGCLRHYFQHGASIWLGTGRGQLLLLPGEDYTDVLGHPEKFGVESAYELQTLNANRD